jgi:DNA-binding IclR family transcriptional regulator
LAEKNQNTSSTALRVFAVLEFVLNFRRPVTIADVCANTGLDRPTAYRALLTLIEAGYVLRDSTAKAFRASYKIVSLARFMLSEDLSADSVRAILRKIVDATGETCHYSVLEGFETVTTMREKGDQLVSVDFKIGDRGKLHCTSIGKALLAYQSSDFVEAFLARPMERLTSRTICTADELRRELAHVRTSGLAVDDNEMSEGMRCVAVPIRETGDIVRAGISISGPASRYTDDYLRQLGDVLIKYSRELSQNLSH